MDSTSILNFQKEIYYFEIQRSEKFDSRLQAPLAIIALLVGFLGFLIKSVKFTSEPLGVSYFIVAYSFSTFLLIGSLILLQSAWGGSKYRFLPLANVLDQYHSDLTKHYTDGDTVDLKSVQSYYEKAILGYYVECSTHNSLINESRARSLFWSVILLGGSVICALISYIPYLSYDLAK